jgi:acetoin:2,6-dichlorophenolindophenol oxidoreductase subunit beta
MKKTYAQSLNHALAAILESDKRVHLLGEDLRDPYGGAFKITKELSSRFPERVHNTPISEAAITGLGVGMALGGLRPVVEIMFGDFLTLAADQLINNAAKLPWMFNNKASVPMVLRTPMGGRRGYGATHSQSLEKLFMGVPGLTIVSPSILHDPGALLTHAVLNDDEPVLFIENKSDYGRRLIQSDVEELGVWSHSQSQDPYPTTTLSTTDFQDDNITIITYGGMVPIVMEAMENLLYQEEITSEIVVPSCITPLNTLAMLASLKRTGRVLVVEEGTLANGWGAEVSASLMENGGFSLLHSPIQRVAAKNLPIGNAKTLEEASLPGTSQIIQGVLKVLETQHGAVE